MYTRQTRILNASGLHARPATEFVAEAKKFESKITIRSLDREGSAPANAKSILRVLSEGLTAGTNVELCGDGPDEAQAIDALVALIDGGFGE